MSNARFNVTVGPVALTDSGGITESMPVELHVQLIGRLILRDGSGRDCTPRGVKARGLIGLLALTPDRKRSRRWLEGRLWSDRAPEQASGSLRQTLVEIRAALGSAAEALEADREHIGLCGLSTDLESDPIAAREALASGRELLEGIELRDPAFVDWLKTFAEPKNSQNTIEKFGRS